MATSSDLLVHQIFDAFYDAVCYIDSAEEVDKNRATEIDPEEPRPRMNVVYDGDERNGQRAMMGAVARTMSIVCVLHGLGDSWYDDCKRMREEVYAAVTADETFGGLAEEAREMVVSPNRDGDGNAVTGSIRVQWSIEFVHSRNNATSAVA